MQSKIEGETKYPLGEERTLYAFKHDLQQFLAAMFWLFFGMTIFAIIIAQNSPMWAAFFGMTIMAELVIIVFNLEKKKKVRK